MMLMIFTCIIHDIGFHQFKISAINWRRYFFRSLCRHYFVVGFVASFFRVAPWCVEVFYLGRLK